MVSLGSETLLMKVPPRTDAHGDPVPGTGTTRELHGCSVAPVRTEEDENRAATVTSEASALIPDIHESEIPTTATITWRGRVYRVRGEAMAWVYLDGEDAGVEVTLTTSKG